MVFTILEDRAHMRIEMKIIFHFLYLQSIYVHLKPPSCGLMPIIFLGTKQQNNFLLTYTTVFEASLSFPLCIH